MHSDRVSPDAYSLAANCAGYRHGTDRPVYITNRFLSLSLVGLGRGDRRFLNNFANDISILEYGKVDVGSRDGGKCKFIRFPKMQMREIAPISNSPFSIPLNPFARFSAFESDICVITPLRADVRRFSRARIYREIVFMQD